MVTAASSSVDVDTCGVFYSFFGGLAMEMYFEQRKTQQS